MPDQDNTRQDKNQRAGFASFAGKRIAIAAVLIALVIWVFSIVPGMLKSSGSPPRIKKTAPSESLNEEKENHLLSSNAAPESAHTPQTEAKENAFHGQGPAAMAQGGTAGQAETVPQGINAAHKAAPAQHASPEKDSTAANATAHAAPGKHLAQNTQTTAPETAPNTPKEGHLASDASAPEAHEMPEQADVPVGVVFAKAVIKPLNHELNERWWGWRPNDLINLTDNVNSMQLGILEVTRRSVIPLSERISRTGISDALNRHLENAVNWLMVKPDRYWFPSPESKYKESLEELQTYIEQLMKHKASFYTRSDNIIPLLSSFQELLGSCDENLVKQKEKDGSPVSYFKADDYFYYAKGVASAMATILEAVHIDFATTLENRNGIELLHHAIESCKQASDLSPWLITNRDLDGIFANHRANIAAPISHARFYIGQLIKTLST